MISRRAVSFGAFSALALGLGLAATPASAFTQGGPFDGKTGGSAYHPQGPGISCFVVGASCNKGSMPPSMGSGGRWDRGSSSYPGHDRGQPSYGWPPVHHGSGLGGPY